MIYSFSVKLNILDSLPRLRLNDKENKGRRREHGSRIRFQLPDLPQQAVFDEVVQNDVVRQVLSQFVPSFERDVGLLRIDIVRPWKREKSIV